LLLSLKYEKKSPLPLIFSINDKMEIVSIGKEMDLELKDKDKADLLIKKLAKLILHLNKIRDI
ncbi:MAG: hypothetical protein JXJ04_08540, partial [Spirochaetales bacterium]|nr:hypothetical protein [Spirochaetales bacterium]